MTMWPEMPDCGVYLVWPCEGSDWIHPEDVAIANELIPSNRVFRRLGFDGEYYQLQYGERRLRVKPTLWLKVEHEDLDIGDQVEVRSRFLENTPLIGVIHDVRFDNEHKHTVYYITHRDQVQPHAYRLSDLEKLTHHYHLHERTEPPPPLASQNPNQWDHSERLSLDVGDDVE